jgi:hypothetical protein
MGPGFKAIWILDWDTASPLDKVQMGGGADGEIGDFGFLILDFGLGNTRLESGVRGVASGERERRGGATVRVGIWKRVRSSPPIQNQNSPGLSCPNA